MEKLLLKDNRLVDLRDGQRTGLPCAEAGGCRSGEIIVRENARTHAFSSVAADFAAGRTPAGGPERLTTNTSWSSNQNPVLRKLGYYD